MTELPLDEVEDILDSLEKDGLVWKRWDVVKQDYVWNVTEVGKFFFKIVSEVEK